jgi:hypothetical protein
MYKDGVEIGELPIQNLRGAMSLNDYGYFELVTNVQISVGGIIPLGAKYPLEYYAVDNDVVVYRKTALATMSRSGKPRHELHGSASPQKLLFAGKILDREEGEDKKGEFTKLGIYGLNELISRRDVDYQATESETDKTDYADDMMKEIVTENMGSSATAARQFPSAFSVAADVANAPSITYEFPQQNVLDTLQNIAEISAVEGTDLYFDVRWQSPTSLQFRTYTDQPGVDTTDRILFSDVRGNIAFPKLSEKYSGEYNVVNAYGMGEPPYQMKSQQEDTTRSGRSLWARREYSFYVGNISFLALLYEAKAELGFGKPNLAFSCKLLDTHPSALYGIHWNYGDRVRVEFNGKTYDGLVNRLEVDYNAIRGERKFMGGFVYTRSIG